MYGYAGGDPINQSDPFGLCPKTAKDGSICLDFFIKAASAGPWKGDGRDFDANAAASASRVQVVASDDGVSFQSASPSAWKDGTGSTASSLDVGFSRGKGGAFTVTVEATNNLRVGGVLPNPSINASVTFTPNGSGGYSVNGNRDAMPDLGIYQRVGGAWKELDRREAKGAPYLLPIAPNDKWSKK